MARISELVELLMERVVESSGTLKMVLFSACSINVAKADFQLIISVGAPSSQFRRTAVSPKSRTSPCDMPGKAMIRHVTGISSGMMVTHRAEMPRQQRPVHFQHRAPRSGSSPRAVTTNGYADRAMSIQLNKSEEKPRHRSPPRQKITPVPSITRYHISKAARVGPNVGILFGAEVTSIAKTPVSGTGHSHHHVRRNISPSGA